MDNLGDEYEGRFRSTKREKINVGTGKINPADDGQSEGIYF